MGAHLLQRLKSRSGFTVLELLLVLAIIAIIAGGLLVAYVDLEADAASGYDAFDSTAISRSMRLYKVLNGRYPDSLDSLHDDTFLGQLLDRLDSGLTGRLTPGFVFGGEITALNNVGITVVRVFDLGAGPGQYDNERQ